MRNKAIILAGPTGSGKTGAALHLADLLQKNGQNAMVVNADSRQIYRDFPIITAQPSAEEQTVCPHLLYGYLETEAKSTAKAWADKAKQTIAPLFGTTVPLLVGGTGMYLKSLTDGMADIPDVDPAISARLLKECTASGSAALHEKLRTLDPETAGRLHPHDRQRIIRALEVHESTGKPLSWWHARHVPGPDWDILRLGIGLPLPELEPYLYQRIDLMLEAGALQEAETALARCPDTSSPGWSGIGCAELAAYLEKRLSFDQCIAQWGHNTRAYAKRQWTWFRADTRITWFRPEDKKALTKLAMDFLAE